MTIEISIDFRYACSPLTISPLTLFYLPLFRLSLSFTFPGLLPFFFLSFFSNNYITPLPHLLLQTFYTRSFRLLFLSIQRRQEWMRVSRRGGSILVSFPTANSENRRPAKVDYYTVDYARLSRAAIWIVWNFECPSRIDSNLPPNRLFRTLPFLPHIRLAISFSMETRYPMAFRTRAKCDTT